jgi:hypothetical protein
MNITPQKNSMPPYRVVPANTGVVLYDVASERIRQESLVRDGKIPWTCSDPNIPDGGKSFVLGEEYGEVCRAAYECYNCDTLAARGSSEKRKHLRLELIQLAAVAVAWVESIDNE